jgi:hypothetical protein
VITTVYVRVVTPSSAVTAIATVVAPTTSVSERDAALIAAGWPLMLILALAFVVVAITVSSVI